MGDIRKLAWCIKPYWRRSVAALLLLTALVVADLYIPRLIRRIIDEGITQHNQEVVIQTALLMLGITVVSTALAVGNNILSVQVGESVARDLQETLFRNSERFATAYDAHLLPHEFLK